MRSRKISVAGSFLTLLQLWIAANGVWAEEAKPVPLEIKVSSAESGQPVDNASVYVKFKEGRWYWKDKRREWHAKTNREGLVRFPAVPQGKALIQVVAEGWKTFGEYYDITEAHKKVIEIKLQRPRRWY